MKKILMAASVMTLLWSCSKKDELLQQTAPSVNKGIAPSAADGKWDVLGFGYDITGEYANSNSSRYKVVDVERIKADYANYVDMSGAESGDTFFQVGENAEDFLRNITVTTKITPGTDPIGIFKGTIDANFTQNDKFTSKYVYATYNSRIIKRGVKMISDVNVLRSYLTPEFTLQLQTAAPKDLVSYYGTHVLSDIKLGGQISIIYQAQTNTSDRKSAAGAGAEFAFGKIFNANIKTTYDQTIHTSNYNESVKARTIGGNAQSLPGAVTFNSAGTPSQTMDVSNWAAGVTDANSELIEIRPGGAIALYDLVADQTKRDALKAYIDQYIIDNAVQLSYSDPNANPYSTVDGMGDYAEGGGVALGSFNGNAAPDAVFMVQDAPSGANEFRYKIAYDMSNGIPGSMSSMKRIPGMCDVSEGTGIAVADIDRNGQDDIILMAYDAPNGPNEFRYKIGYNINGNGDASYWTGMKRIAGIADASRSAGISFGDIDKNGVLDVILMAYDIPSGANQIRYKVGYNVNQSGDALSWSNTKYVSGLADNINGAAISLADMDNNGTLDLVVFAEYDGPQRNEYRYKIGYSINNSGIVSYWSNVVTQPGTGWFSDGSGIAFGNLDGNPAKDAIVMSIDAPAGPNEIRYRVGLNLNSSGITSTWR